jgi:uncharacterized protein YoxC
MDVVALVTAIACVVSAIALFVIGLRIVSLSRSVEAWLVETRAALARLDAGLEEIREVAQGAQRLERRVSGVVEPLLDQVEPPVRTVASVIGAVRTGFGALLRGAGSRGGKTPGADGTARPGRA